MKYLILLAVLFCLDGACYSQPKLDLAERQQLDHLFKAYTKNTSPGYSVAIVKKEQIWFTGHYGMANLDYKFPINSNSAFDIASVSKQFTAACIALLIMDGKLSLDMPASRFIPELSKYRDTIRICHLIYNTSGITDYYKLPRGGGRSWVTFDYFTIDECIRTSLRSDTLLFVPGAKWDYCNTNYMLLTKIIEKVSGQSFSGFAHDRLFLPLGMQHTLINDDATAIIPNRVTPYNKRTREIVGAYRKEGFAVKYGSGWIQHPRNSPHYGGSGVNTTTGDLAKWEENFFTKRVGGEYFYRLMHLTPHFQNGMDNQAFGLYRDTLKGRIYWAWDGGDYGVSAQIIRFPRRQIAIIVLSNVGSGDAAGKAEKIAELLIAHRQL